MQYTKDIIVLLATKYIWLECQKPLLNFGLINLHNFMSEYVIPNVVHSQHALAWMKFVVVRKALKYRA